MLTNFNASNHWCQAKSSAAIKKLEKNVDAQVRDPHSLMVKFCTQGPEASDH